MSQNTINQISCSIPCDLCGSTTVEELSLIDREGKPLRTVICRDCGQVWSDPRPAPEAVREYYQNEYRKDYKATYQPRPVHVYRAGKVAVDRFGRLAKILKPGWRILDVGAGSGEVVYVLRAKGFEASGFEPNEGYAQFAAEALGVPVTHGFYQDTQIAPEALDFVTMFHVVEHLESPLNVMRQVRGWLRPGGHLLVEVPNVEAVCQWPRSLFHRAHLYNFSPATLETTGRKAGYRLVNSTVSSDGGNIAVILQKIDPSENVSGKIPGNFERVRAIVKGHTAFKHLFSAYPYVRPFRRIAARLEERRATKGNPSPRQIIDRLIQAET